MRKKLSNAIKNVRWSNLFFIVEVATFISLGLIMAASAVISYYGQVDYHTVVSRVIPFFSSIMTLQIFIIPSLKKGRKWKLYAKL